MICSFAGFPTLKTVLVQGVEIDMVLSRKLRREALQRVRDKEGTSEQLFQIPDESKR